MTILHADAIEEFRSFCADHIASSRRGKLKLARAVTAEQYTSPIDVPCAGERRGAGVPKRRLARPRLSSARTGTIVSLAITLTPPLSAEQTANHHIRRMWLEIKPIRRRDYSVPTVAKVESRSRSRGTVARGLVITVWRDIVRRARAASTRDQHDSALSHRPLWMGRAAELIHSLTLVSLCSTLPTYVYTTTPLARNGSISVVSPLIRADFTDSPGRWYACEW